MIGYGENNSRAPEIKRNFTIKKAKRVSNLKTDNPLMLITNSEPVTPSRPIIPSLVRTSRNTIDYFIQLTSKNKPSEPCTPSLFPSLAPDSQSNKLLKPNQTKKRSLQRELMGGEQMDNFTINPVIWNRNRVATSGTERVRVESKMRQKSITIDVDGPRKIKPLLIQNKFLSKLCEIKKPGSHQMRYFRNKVIKGSRTQQNPEQLFTFYPRHDENKAETDNQFLGIY